MLVEVSEDLHQELRKTAIMNELKLYKLVNGIIKGTLSDTERLNEVIRRLRTSKS